RARRPALTSPTATRRRRGGMSATSGHDPARIPEAELRRRGLASPPDEVAGYFPLAYRVTADAVVAASSGWPQPGWTVLANRSVLVVERATLTMSEFSIGPALPPGRAEARSAVGR